MNFHSLGSFPGVELAFNFVCITASIQLLSNSTCPCSGQRSQVMLMWGREKSAESELYSQYTKKPYLTSWHQTTSLSSFSFSFLEFSSENESTLWSIMVWNFILSHIGTNYHSLIYSVFFPPIKYLTWQLESLVRSWGDGSAGKVLSAQAW